MQENANSNTVSSITFENSHQVAMQAFVHDERTNSPVDDAGLVPYQPFRSHEDVSDIFLGQYCKYVIENS